MSPGVEFNHNLELPPTGVKTQGTNVCECEDTV
jgi:hypothetical protein